MNDAQPYADALGVVKRVLRLDIPDGPLRLYLMLCDAGGWNLDKPFKATTPEQISVGLFEGKRSARVIRKQLIMLHEARFITIQPVGRTKNWPAEITLHPDRPLLSVVNPEQPSGPQKPR